MEYPNINYLQFSATGVAITDFRQCHGVKVVPGPWDLGPWELGPGTRDPTESLKVGPGTPLKFKSRTPGSPSKFWSGNLGPPSKFKSGAPHLSLMNLFFSEYFIVIYFIFVSFLNKIYTKNTYTTVSSRNQ